VWKLLVLSIVKYQGIFFIFYLGNLSMYFVKSNYRCCVVSTFNKRIQKDLSGFSMILSHYIYSSISKLFENLKMMLYTQFVVSAIIYMVY